jgi:hypothetical protein
VIDRLSDASEQATQNRLSATKDLKENCQVAERRGSVKNLQPDPPDCSRAGG